MDQMSTEADQRKKEQPKQQQIEWRRGRVLELSSQGRTEREIATMLQVGKTTVDRDLAYLRRQSQEKSEVSYSGKFARTIPKMYEWTKPGIEDGLEYCSPRFY